MHIHIVFATYSSGTQSAAEYIQSLLVASGHTVELYQAKDTKDAELSDCDMLLIGSPSWERDNYKYNGQPHHDFFTLFHRYGFDIDDHEHQSSSLNLKGKRCAIFGLGDRTYPVFCGATDHLKSFFVASRAEVVGEILRLHAYYFHQEEAHAQIDRWLPMVIPVA